MWGSRHYRESEASNAGNIWIRNKKRRRRWRQGHCGIKRLEDVGW
jgi:hypothetical protein